VPLLVFRSSSQIWAELHEKAFRRLGGVTRVVVLDNLKEGVLTPDIYDPTLNPLYRDVLSHYGSVGDSNARPLPCQGSAPNRRANRLNLKCPALAANLRSRITPRLAAEFAGVMGLRGS
jgi:hypothetical protein